MNFFKNIKFLSQLTYDNISEYPQKRIASSYTPITKNSINWYGHATVLINLNGNTIVTDPVLTNMLGYFKRIVEKPFDLQNVDVNYILLSHGHMDHLHFPSLRKLNKDSVVIVPKGYKKILKFLGFKKVVLLRPGEVYEDDNLKITSIRANHDGRRFYVGIDNESNSYMIESKVTKEKVFFAGDTAFTDSFNNLECDVALMPVGCYKPDRFAYMHCTPEQSYKMFKSMKANTMIPIHYKTFKISLENFKETEQRLLKLHDKKIKLLDIGETYSLT